MIKHYHTETKEWISSEELQKRFNERFDFKCNECHKEIGNHLKTLAEGIFCVDCYNEILKDFEAIFQKVKSKPRR